MAKEVTTKQKKVTTYTITYNFGKIIPILPAEEVLKKWKKENKLKKGTVLEYVANNKTLVFMVKD